MISHAAFIIAYAAEGFDAAKVAKDEALAARLPKDIKAKGTLTIGSDTTYPPAEFLAGPDGQTPEGIDVDLAKAMAQKWGLKLEFLTAQFASILPAIGPRYDLGVSAFTITNERYKAVDFVSYFNAGKQWAVQAGNPAHFNPEDPCGTTVGAQTGSTGEKAVVAMSNACAAAKKAPIEIVSMPKQTDLITRLINGAVHAVYAGSTNIGYAVKQTNGQLETIGKITNPSPNGIAVSKGQTEWAKLVADTINGLIADGTYGQIMAKWGIQSAALEKAEVNPKVEE
ncbi:amino acid ABC transporter substrate-binding protein, PAAT family [Rhizobium sp. RU35A]|uniref:ABC transporter substrate-binding protein n=1 Tax=Rhizobium sp. RU35A TaxID=1907414 RepID=UPI00095409D8|nr:ABC transporter substrate-binding protein [Rhizobium sp. RU35A]SIR38499.1 amino acid ABC transporter substrate-binding protein, PAAT family [Rhizobium sp. RU35A]